MAKRPGRPRLDEHDETVQIYTSITAREFDRLCRIAHRHDVPLAVVVRRLLATTRDDDDHDDE